MEEMAAGVSLPDSNAGQASLVLAKNMPDRSLCRCGGAGS